MTPQPTTFTVEAKNRAVVGKQVRQLRTQGLLPAVVYGHNKASIALTVPTKEFVKVYLEAGSSSLIDLKIEGAAAQKVLVHDFQISPASRQPLHVDFYLVNMKEKLQTEIPLEFVGVAPAVEIEGGTLLTIKNELNVECLPQDLVPHIEIDISTLVTLDDVIRIKDLTIPAGIEVLDDEEEVVISINAPRSEEDLAALDEAPEATVAEVESLTGNEPVEDDKEDDK